MYFLSSLLVLVIQSRLFLHEATASEANVTSTVASHSSTTTPSPAGVHPTTNSTTKKFKTEGRSHNTRAEILTSLIDSSTTGARVIADVINFETSAAAYTVHITDCSDNIPVNKYELEPAVDKRLPRISKYPPIKSQVYWIPPLRSRSFSIALDFRNSSKRLSSRGFCILNVLNRLNEKIYRKLITFSPEDTCVCAVNCACSCFSQDPMLECKEILDEQQVSEWKRKIRNDSAGSGNETFPVSAPYAPSSGSSSSSSSSATKNTDSQKGKQWLNNKNGAEAGGAGGEEGTTTGWILSKNWRNSLKDLDDKHLLYLNLLVIIIMVLILLLLGTCKGLCGICCFPIGRCGLKHFYDKPRILAKYHEKKYSKYTPIHDAEGYPLDPFTRARTVKRLSPNLAFCLNTVFFLCCPFFCLFWIRECCFKDKEYPGFDDETKDSPPGSSSSRRQVQTGKGTYLSKSLEETRTNPITTTESTRTNTRLQVEASNTAKRILASAGSEYELTPVGSEEQMYSNEGEDEEEEEGELSLGQFNNEGDKGNNQSFIAGHAQIYPDVDASTPLSLTPISQSLTLLETLNRQPQDFNQPLRKRGHENNNTTNPPCCGPGLSYGSWHRSPAIFEDVYDGDSRFDLTKTVEMSRRRNNGKHRSDCR